MAKSGRPSYVYFQAFRKVVVVIRAIRRPSESSEAALDRVMSGECEIIVDPYPDAGDIDMSSLREMSPDEAADYKK